MNEKFDDLNRKIFQVESSRFSAMRIFFFMLTKILHKEPSKRKYTFLFFFFFSHAVPSQLYKLPCKFIKVNKSGFVFLLFFSQLSPRKGAGIKLECVIQGHIILVI